jgi:hypothetical protein
MAKKEKPLSGLRGSPENMVLSSFYRTVFSLAFLDISSLFQQILDRSKIIE